MSSSDGWRMYVSIMLGCISKCSLCCAHGPPLVKKKRAIQSATTPYHNNLQCILRLTSYHLNSSTSSNVFVVIAISILLVESWNIQIDRISMMRSRKELVHLAFTFTRWSCKVLQEHDYSRAASSSCSHLAPSRLKSLSQLRSLALRTVGKCLPITWQHPFWPIIGFAIVMSWNYNYIWHDSYTPT